jgi:protein involved in polysaccharide export with SLBB domain
MKTLTLAVALLITSACHSGAAEVLKPATNTPAKSYTVGGNGVNAPGVFTYKEGITITEAIKLAGGWTKSALKNKVELVRNGESRARDVNVSQIELGKTNDIKLMPGDYVLVEESRVLKLQKP